jgi:hypothetical protein
LTCRHAGYFDDIAILLCWVDGSDVKPLPRAGICGRYAAREKNAPRRP